MGRRTELRPFFLLFALSALLTAYSDICQAGERAIPQKLAVGVATVGGQIHYRFTPRWAVEARYLIGEASSEAGDVAAQVIGGRLYRFFPLGRRTALFAGIEGDSLAAKAASDDYKTTGYAAGGYIGLQWRFARRWTLGFDIGPYYLSMKERTAGISDSGLEFVGNSFINFYLF